MPNPRAEVSCRVKLANVKAGAYATARGKGKHVTGFTNGEEAEVQLTKVVPFLVEDELLRPGAIYEKMANWLPFSTIGRLITGQNPSSSTSAGAGSSEASRAAGHCCGLSIESASQNPRVASNGAPSSTSTREEKVKIT